MAELRPDSDIIGNFRILKNFLAVSVAIKNEAYTQILGCVGVSLGEFFIKNVLKKRADKVPKKYRKSTEKSGC